MDIEIPLISPLSRKYYDYATDNDEKIHHRALDARHCLEIVCNQLVIQFISNEEKSNWGRYTLAKKLSIAKAFMSPEIVDEVREVKDIGNTGVHEGEESSVTDEDIKLSLEAIRKFSLDVILSYFRKYDFEFCPEGSWIPAVFSTLPPVYRVEILNKYYKEHPTSFVIDKLSKAYLKDRRYEEGLNFLGECLKKKEINNIKYNEYCNDLKLSWESFDRLPIARNLEQAKKNFLILLPGIKEEERDLFVCLVSMILLGE